MFLSDPSGYDGGELILEGAGGESGYKLEAGAAIAYPSTSLHRVSPVTSGRREAAVTWAQSMVRSAERREILFDLDRPPSPLQGCRQVGRIRSDREVLRQPAPALGGALGRLRPAQAEDGWGARTPIRTLQKPWNS